MTSTLSILDQSGDTRIEWDASNPVEVAAARAAFKVAKDKGYLAYKAEEGGGRGEVIRRFDPDAERIIMQPQNQGG